MAQYLAPSEHDKIYARALRAAHRIPYNFNSQDIFFDPTNGDDGNDGSTPVRAMKTLAAAENKAAANNHDVVWYIPGSSGHNLSAALTWDKNYTHFIGLAAPSTVGTRARLFQLSTLTGASPLINITATGCRFQNFYVFQGVNDATSLINVQVSGGRNYFEGVHFAGGGHATQAVDGCASLTIAGGGENRFQNCTFGVDTIAAATGVTCVSYAATGATPRTMFYNCKFTLQAGNGGASFIESLGNLSSDRYQYFENCAFLNVAESTAIDSAVVAPATNGPKWFVFYNPMWVQVTKVDANDRSLVYGNVDAYTSADLGGVAVVLQE